MNDGRIKRALCHNVTPSGEIKYVTGDKVFYKRDDSNEWRGPCVVIGQVNQQVFVKHGSFYIRLHPCRLQLVNPIRQPSTAPINDQSHQHNHSNEYATDTLKDQPDISYSSGSVKECPDKTSRQNEHSDNVETTSHQPNHTASHSITTSKQSAKVVPKTQIRYKVNHNDDWDEATVVKRAGKSTGKYPNCWNIKSLDGTEKFINLDKIYQFQIPDTKSKNIQETEPKMNDTAKTENYSNLVEQPITEEKIVDEVLLSQNKEQEAQAKLAELNQWKIRQVYSEIDDEGQQCVSLRWVLKSKIIDNKPGIKARLCARGFEEESNFRTDSPTCSREGVRIAFSLITSKKWPVKSIDVKTAFLQGKNLERNVLVQNKNMH